MSSSDEWSAYQRQKKGIKEIEGVTGIGLGGPEVIAYVKRLTPEIMRDLPEDVEGIPLKVKEVGRLRILPLVTLSSSRVQRYRPVPGGVSVGHFLGDTGTHGCAVKYGSEIVGISNAHVAGLQWGSMQEGQVGDAVLQPGLLDLSAPDTEIGQSLKIWRVPPIEEGISSIDATIYSGEFNLEILDIGLPGPSIRMEPGMIIAKSGRTTSLTTNKVESIDATVDIEGYGEARFENVVITESSFSGGGDSGALAVDQYARSAGLVFAGSDRATVICEATEIERLLGVEFGFAEPHLLELTYDASPTLMWVPVLVGSIMCYLSTRRL